MTRDGQAGDDADTAGHVHGSIEQRLRLAFGCRPLYTPPLNRSSMVPHSWGTLNPFARWLKSGARRRPHQQIERK
ncbi:MAG: Glucans biosynthesis glucosyltransferase, partial [Herminiimonas sp.]|nr:Glucans biosynthesis glucosyltransferase [Herminiimonas sp.]